jgi:hypothetical protein
MSPPISADDAAAGRDDGHQRGSHLGSSLTYPRSASVLGYCLLPLVLVSTLGIVVPLDGLFGYLLTSLSIMWCSYSSSSMFTIVGKLRQEHSATQIANNVRPYDINERSCRIPYGTILWQLWHHGDLQFSRYWAVGQGGRSCMRDHSEFAKVYLANHQHTANGVRYHERRKYNFTLHMRHSHWDENGLIGVRQLISVSCQE